MVYAYSKTSQTFVLEKGFPTDSNIIFPGIPEFLDAAFETNGIVYFISRSVYYTGPISNNKTMPVSRTAVNITGLPLNIDGAYSWMENETTFFREDTFYVSDKKVKKVRVCNARISIIISIYRYILLFIIYTLLTLLVTTYLIINIIISIYYFITVYILSQIIGKQSISKVFFKC